MKDEARKDGLPDAATCAACKLDGPCAHAAIDPECWCPRFDPWAPNEDDEFDAEFDADPDDDEEF